MDMDKQDLMIKEFLSSDKAPINDKCFTQNVMLSLPERPFNKGWLVLIGIFKIFFISSITTGVLFFLSRHQILSKIYNFALGAYYSALETIANYKEQILSLCLYFAGLCAIAIISTYKILHQKNNNETISGVA